MKKLRQGEAKLKTIEGLQLEVGFQNRTTFYDAFRKIMGCKVTSLIAQLKEKE